MYAFISFILQVLGYPANRWLPISRIHNLYNNVSKSNNLFSMIFGIECSQWMIIDNDNIYNFLCHFYQINICSNIDGPYRFKLSICIETEKDSSKI